MAQDQVLEIVYYIVDSCIKLKDKHTDQTNAPVNYVAIFAQSDEEYDQLSRVTQEIGAAVQKTATGEVYKLHSPIKTAAGILQLLKIRRYYPDHPERGDTDFRVDNYQSFKDKYLDNSNHFNLITRTNYEMIELRDPEFDVLAYFPNIPLTKDLGII